jgi:hypothetical protein
MRLLLSRVLFIIILIAGFYALGAFGNAFNCGFIHLGYQFNLASDSDVHCACDPHPDPDNCPD